MNNILKIRFLLLSVIFALFCCGQKIVTSEEVTRLFTDGKGAALLDVNGKMSYDNKLSEFLNGRLPDGAWCSSKDITGILLAVYPEEFGAGMEYTEFSQKNILLKIRIIDRNKIKPMAANLKIFELGFAVAQEGYLLEIAPALTFSEKVDYENLTSERGFEKIFRTYRNHKDRAHQLRIVARIDFLNADQTPFNGRLCFGQIVDSVQEAKY
ncbi:hypothetical protein [Leptospira licerasiae]|uniref:hypothetical protein n=1 Tax=Leptospira licerasiae TaxID=447106 RepID=UPI003019F787